MEAFCKTLGSKKGLQLIAMSWEAKMKQMLEVTSENPTAGYKATANFLGLGRNYSYNLVWGRGVSIFSSEPCGTAHSWMMH